MVAVAVMTDRPFQAICMPTTTASWDIEWQKPPMHPMPRAGRLFSKRRIEHVAQRPSPVPLENSGGEPLALSCSASFATLFLGAAMANPGSERRKRERISPSIPTQSGVKGCLMGLLDAPSLVMPHCNASRNFRNRFGSFLETKTRWLPRGTGWLRPEIVPNKQASSLSSSEPDHAGS